MLLAFLAAVVAGPAQCMPVDLSFVDLSPALGAEPTRQTIANFQEAYSTACAEGLLNDRPLLPPAQKQLLLVNAPNANVASIYSRDAQTVLEYPFIAEGGALNVPAAEELHEAIYCAIVGATEAEQEESGRCLPD